MPSQGVPRTRLEHKKRVPETLLLARSLARMEGTSVIGDSV